MTRIDAPVHINGTTMEVLRGSVRRFKKVADGKIVLF